MTQHCQGAIAAESRPVGSVGIVRCCDFAAPSEDAIILDLIGRILCFSIPPKCDRL